MNGETAHGVVPLTLWMWTCGFVSRTPDFFSAEFRRSVTNKNGPRFTIVGVSFDFARSLRDVNAFTEGNDKFVGLAVERSETTGS